MSRILRHCSCQQNGGRLWLRLLAVSMLFLLQIPCARAHETPIALLKLKEVRPGSYVENWTYSSSRNLSVPRPQFPEHCRYEPPRLNCGEKGLLGDVTITALGDRYSAVVLRITAMDNITRSFTLTAAAPVLRIDADGKLPLGQLAKSYVSLGFEHILLGVDHLLFVAGLMLLVSTPWMLLKTITAFTLAHSLALAAVTLGWLGVPERPVNAAIALSIVFVAIDVLKKRSDHTTWSARFPWAVAFGFGLLHGLGFAGALSRIGLPRDNLIAALLFFNVGVESGQVGFVLLILALGSCHRQLKTTLPRWGLPIAVYAMGSVASYWFIMRVWVLLQPAFVTQGYT